MAKAARKSSTKRSKASTPRFSKRYPRLDDLPVVHRQAAGIDLGGATSHFVAVEVGDEIEVQEFGVTTPALWKMAAYLAAHGVTTVAMEATGVYWVPVYDLLEQSGFEVYLANPSHAKNVPGRRKDDKQDCKWLQKLHKYGLLSASFRPSEAIRPLRSFHRQRARLVRLSADEVRRMQQALDMMNLGLHKVVSDICGQTGMRIIRAILDGERDPGVLAKMRNRRCHCTEEELREAMTGFYQGHQLFALKQALARYEALLGQIAEVDTEIETYLRTLIPLGDAEIAETVASASQPLPTGKHVPAYNVAAYVELLLGQDTTTIPGIAAQLALGLLAELGPDMTRWPTDGHLGSYLTFAPQPKISGGKVLSTRTRQGPPPAAALLKQAAAAVIQTDTALAAFYWRKVIQLGKAKALTALAYKIARMYYHLLREGRAYVELGVEQYEAKYRQQQIAVLEKKAKRLGLTVTPTAA
jgi:transposase